MGKEFELFKGKNLSELFKDIYNNSVRNKKQLQGLLKEVSTFIKNTDSAERLVPVIKEYLDINVKNDEQLIKLAQIVQRLITAEDRAMASPGQGGFLPEEEKQQILQNLNDAAQGLQVQNDKIIKTIEQATPDLD